MISSSDTSSGDPFISFTDSSSGSPVQDTVQKADSTQELPQEANSPQETPKRMALPARPIQLERKFSQIENEEMQQNVEFVLKQKLSDIAEQIESLSQIISFMSCTKCSGSSYADSLDSG